MGSFSRFTRYIKDFWKVVIRGENDDLRRQTVRMEEELSRLRNRRLASDKEREGAALNQARNAVQKLRDLHDNFLAAEQAAAEFAAKLGDAAKSSLEAHKEMREEACKKFFTQQKQHMFAKQIVPELPSSTSAPISHANEQDKESRVLDLETSRAADDKDIVFAAMEADGPCFHAVEVNDEGNGDVRQVNKDGTSSSVSSTNAAVDNLELMDPHLVAQMLEEARRQVRLEEKSHFDALSRKKAILEKEIEAREMAERASMPQGQ